MSVLNKTLFLIVFINILIISVKSYSLKQYENGRYNEIISRAGGFQNKVNISKDEVLYFQIALDISVNDKHGVYFAINTGSSQQINLTFYDSFGDVIADGTNSNKSIGITPLIAKLCIVDVFSFSIQVTNDLEGPLLFSIDGQSDEHCYQNESVINSIDLSFQKSNSQPQEDSSHTASASTLLSNGIFLFSIITLFCLQII
ncbi:hypothetical protein ACTA71_011276 [Dictyostelium dimigraforme]